MNRSRPLTQSMRRWIFFSATSVVAVGALAIAAQVELQRRAEVIDRNFEAASLHARAFEDHLTQSFNVVNLTLVNAAEVDPGGVHAATPLRGYAAALRPAPYLRSLAVLEAGGRIVASSDARSLGRRVALDGFLPSTPGFAEVLRVGPPWAGRDFSDGHPIAAGEGLAADALGFLTVSRDVALDDGRHVTLLAAVNGDYFVNHYSRSLDPADATVDLLRYDGMLLVSTHAARTPGARQGAALLTARLAQSEIGRFEQRVEDGRSVLTAYRASRAYPFVVVVEFDRARVLAGWQRNAVADLAMVIGVLLAAMAVATWYYFRLEQAARSRDAARAALLASEAQYRNTFDKAAVGVMHTSPKGSLQRCNQYLCDMLGYTADELTRKTVDQITHPEDRGETRRLARGLLAGDWPSYRTEKRYLRKTGEPIWVGVTAGVARNPGGGVEYGVAVVEDIHLRRLTRLALQALGTELTGEAFLRQMTRTLAELLGMEIAFIGETARASTPRIDARAAFVDGEFVPNFSCALADTPFGSLKDSQMRIHAARVQDEFAADALLRSWGVESLAAVALGNTEADGTLLGVLAVMSRRPLRQTEAVQTLMPLLASRVAAELVREREARKFRDLFDGSPSAVFLVDRHETIRMSSRSGERLFGWAPQTLIGQPLALLIPDDRREAYLTQLRRFANVQGVGGPSDSGSTDIWGRRSDGSDFPAQVQLRKLETADGPMTVAHVQDISARLLAQAELQRHNEALEGRVAARTAELSQARDAAEQASRAKSAFLAAMSHEIRTPMNGVVGMIDLLEQTSLKRSQQEIVKTVRESAHALLGIVDGVLDFSKIEAGQFQVDNQPMGVASVVEAVCDTLAPLAGDRGVALSLFTDPAIPALLLGDAARLRQVLLNLAGNAIKFSAVEGRPGQVAVRAQQVQAGAQRVVVEFSVADNGIGMDADTLSRLFTPFTQADASTTRRYGGTGLGLSISRGLVELMGGQIAAHSVLGEGSRFTVRLPLALLPPSAAADTPALELAGLRCLVIGGPNGPADDLAVYLAHGGATVYRVADRAAALAWFGRCDPGLWLGVVAGIDETLDTTLAELRSACRARPQMELRLVVIAPTRRGNRRPEADDMVTLDSDSLHRSVFLHAVSLAAGLVEADSRSEPSAAADTMPAPLSMPDAEAQHRLILVAEDNDINQLVLRQQLAVLGFAAQVCGNGREALACALRQDYPLLITDLHMPELDGYGLAAAIRAAESGQRRMPIVALTANALKEEAQRCRDVGMDDYMTKPVQLADLKAMLLKWLPAPAGETTLQPQAPVCQPGSTTAQGLDQ